LITLALQPATKQIFCKQQTCAYQEKGNTNHYSACAETKRSPLLTDNRIPGPFNNLMFIFQQNHAYSPVVISLIP
jgi:hypothetical protein